MSGTLLRRCRLVPVGAVAPDSGTAPVDVRVAGGRVVEVGTDLRPLVGDEVHDAAGRWALPGLWDKHVHLVQWALASTRLDTAGTRSPAEVLERVGRRLASIPSRPDEVIVGVGHRVATWDRTPTVTELDAVTGGRPVVLIAGDGHNGWVNSAACTLLGVAAPVGLLEESQWFPLYGRLAELPAVRAEQDRAYAATVQVAATLGVVGIVDFEFGSDFLLWPDRVAGGITGLRVRAATYPEGLAHVLRQGLRTGDPLTPGQDRVVMGPLKVISDGSLNTRTAYCSDPYADSTDQDFNRGRELYGVEELVDLLGQARAGGLDVAVHAIGDEALSTVLDAFEVSGARGGIEHAQLVQLEDLARMARLGLTASVQPAHLWDDRDVTDRLWPDRTDRCFMFRSMLDAGVRLALGSDAPVARLDPWLAMAAAVHRSADEREPWHPEQALTVAEALAASTDDQPTLAVGSLGDVILVDADPLAPQGDSRSTAEHLRGIHVDATFVTGEATHLAL